LVADVLAAIDDDQNDVGGIGCLGNLFLDACLELVVRVLEAGGIYEPKAVMLVLYLAKDIIAGGTGFTGDDCLLGADHTVKKRTLADVRLTDDRYCWEFRGHNFG